MISLLLVWITQPGMDTETSPTPILDVAWHGSLLCRTALCWVGSGQLIPPVSELKCSEQKVSHNMQEKMSGRSSEAIRLITGTTVAVKTVEGEGGRAGQRRSWKGTEAASVA